jgi:hypothetical protein
MSHIKRSMPFIEAMKRVKSPKARQELFKHLPTFVVDDIAEIIYNILIGNAHISPNYKKRLGQVRHQLYGMIRATSKGKRRKILYKQSGGGIFTVLLPAIASVIASIIASRNTNG